MIVYQRKPFAFQSNLPLPAIAEAIASAGGPAPL